MRDSFPFGIQRLRAMSASDLTARSAVVVVTQWRKFLRLEREAPIITDHDTDYQACALLDAIPFGIIGRLCLPSVGVPRDAAIAGHGVCARWKRLLVCFVVAAQY